jgi:hypothetical protein
MMKSTEELTVLPATGKILDADQSWDLAVIDKAHRLRNICKRSERTAAANAPSFSRVPLVVECDERAVSRCGSSHSTKSEIAKSFSTDAK